LFVFRCTTQAENLYFYNPRIQRGNHSNITSNEYFSAANGLAAKNEVMRILNNNHNSHRKHPMDSLFSRRLLLALTLLSQSVEIAFAQEKFPSKPVTLVVPQAAGGANDAIARIVAQKLGDLTGQSFIVENRPGAGGNIGTAYAAKARPDGYTLLMTADSAYVINPSLYKNTGFDPVKDFEPVSTVATAGYVLVANNNFPANNTADLIQLAKQQPGKIMIGSAGNGTVNHLVGEMLNKAAGIDLVHVPYKGAAAALTDLVGGQVQVSVQSLPSSIGFIRSGRIKVLGVVNEKRLAALPNSSPIQETVAGLSVTPWYAVFAPAGTPKPVTLQLQALISQAIDAADVKEKLANVGAEPFQLNGDQFARFIRSELPRWAKTVKDSGASID
jgi:tripartite-type tricarboxylate transporter receptor subunit TctC